MQNLNWKLIAEIAGGVLFVLLLVWFFFFRSTSGLTPTDTATLQTFGQGESIVQGGAGIGDGSEASGLQSPVSTQKVFKLHDGPVAGAAFMQEARPTTTVARFVLQQNGHVLDLPIDSPGSVARAVSNTTIPGVSQVIWETQTSAARQVIAGAILQYLDNTTVKSVLLNFPTEASTSSLPAPTRVQFLPNDLASLAVSPDGASIAYLAETPSGSDGYVARADGTSTKKLFSLPLREIALLWPSPGTILATTKPATSVPGISFSISASSGAVSPILYVPGLSVTADPGLAHVVYQSSVGDTHYTYAHNMRSGLDRTLSFDPMPEKCVWSRQEASTMYCAAPLSYTPGNYADLWRQGAASAADSIVVYNLLTGQNFIIATPGQDGGVASDAVSLSLSADERYLLFVKKGDRSLWGVRLY